MGKDNILDADGQFDKAPYFNSNDGQLKTDTNNVDNPNEKFGSASLWFPKSFLKTEGVPNRMPFA